MQGGSSAVCPEARAARGGSGDLSGCLSGHSSGELDRLSCKDTRQEAARTSPCLHSLHSRDTQEKKIRGLIGKLGLACVRCLFGKGVAFIKAAAHNRVSIVRGVGGPGSSIHSLP